MKNIKTLGVLHVGDWSENVNRDKGKGGPPEIEGPHHP